MYLTPERAVKIGMILVVASILIMGYSAFGFYTSSSATKDTVIAGGSEKSMDINVTSGLLLTYTITANSTGNFRAWFSEPSGNTVVESNFTGSGISKSIVAPVSGQWVFHVENLEKNSSALKIHLGQISYYLEAGLYFGITVLILGIVFILYFFNVQKRETIRKSKRF
ncbi:MAG: hypothetical protein M1323_03925 [Candidatus Thermoplasmatota archaeon]|jgi:uncharacterized membrane protein YukC|uniref:Membrane protein n=1 Tax=Cuniculiplasma divulgatum TaxID=1673428 RepID=A0A1R4A4P8_9ARCH|nr:hypothetical protein [Cuniculiplasma divulgatum]EQB68721.1 MAG: hypothetical protein AMDU5_GPLC00007G0037 [Thermoplasmatales archaeon Gpl]MCI2412603.1 hypothetical protein [Cuniculiplasma sp.]MCL4320849.1 hypothetical protein [Candidatus Thermoplasmatota archaeon]OWP55615.1 MAG: hypothetical protein B2I18_00250 [Cuniculiplasma sp. C_DKE]MCL6014758.1 hypothetical protein [Candidatus Thermoplasmatota archaeon]